MRTCIGATTRIGLEIQCLPGAGFFFNHSCDAGFSCGHILNYKIAHNPTRQQTGYLNSFSNYFQIVYKPTTGPAPYLIDDLHLRVHWVLPPEVRRWPYFTIFHHISPYFTIFHNISQYFNIFHHISPYFIIF